jgi:hypothetical protein
MKIDEINIISQVANRLSIVLVISTVQSGSGRKGSRNTLRMISVPGTGSLTVVATGSRIQTDSTPPRSPMRKQFLPENIFELACVAVWIEIYSRAFP